MDHSVDSSLPLFDSLSPEEHDLLLERAIDALCHDVDVSWVAEYSQKDYAFLIEFIKSLVCDLLIKEGNIPSAEDMLAYIDGTAWSVDAVLTSCFSQSENSLLILLIAAARHAYRCGVRDAHVRALSTEAQRAISEQLITADAKKTAMRNFHDELSDL